MHSERDPGQLDSERIAAAVSASADLEAAGRALVQPLLDAAAAALAAASGPERQGRLLRGALHVRGEDGYRGLVLVDASPPRARRGAADLSPSTTAWEWVHRLDRAVLVDVQLGELLPVATPGAAPVRLPGGAALSGESQEVLLFRGATHVLALPARAEGAVQGMLTLELQARAVTGAPVRSWERLAPALQAALDRCFPALLAVGGRAPAARAELDGLPVVGRAMASIVRMLRLAAPFDDTILLMGPPGVGKSHLARWIHAASARAGRPFEEVHLQNYPETLVEGELFGWRKGAHDRADRDKVGHVGRAEGGTLFLDEIDKCTRAVQQKLLYLLESRRYRVLGDSGRERQADVRFIVGTNVDLDAEVAAGRFLPDLLWRIRTIPVTVPPLAARRDELREWAAHFLRRKHQRETGSAEATLSEAALALLEAQEWPGNLRQLDQAITRAWLVASAQGRGGPLHVDSQSVRAALDIEPEPASAGLDAALRAAARAFRAELERRSGQPDLRPLELEDANAFRGYVLAELEQAWGLDEAFRALGLEQRVASRNHHATFKRELARIAALWGREEG